MNVNDDPSAGEPEKELSTVEKSDGVTPDQTLAAGTGKEQMASLITQKEISIQLPSGGEITLSELQSLLKMHRLEPEIVLNFACEVIASAGMADEAKLLIDANEIARTASAFSDPENVETLEKAAADFSLSKWIAQQSEKTPQNVTRTDILLWWDFFMQMASVRGYSPGGIDAKSQSLNLWKATARLREKISKNPECYKFIPGTLANNAPLVGQILQNVDHPIAFLELMTGEAIEDMPDPFLSAFSTTDHQGREGAIQSVMLALQRSNK